MQRLFLKQRFDHLSLCFNISNLTAGTYVLNIKPINYTPNVSNLQKLIACYGTPFSDNFTVTVVDNPGASAGTDQNVSCIIGLSLAGNIVASPLQGTWSVVTKPAGASTVTFSNVNNPNATVSSAGTAPAGTYTFRWTVTGSAPGCTTYLDDVSITAASVCILPVTLTSFTATAANNCTAQINWKTSTELNSGFYEIESSTNGVNYAKAATVASKNSSAGGAYSYNFKSLAAGVNYFRIKSVDTDGSSKLSSVIVLRSACTGAAEVTLAPNPAGDIIRLIGLGTKSSITIYNATGQKMTEQTSTQASLQLNVKDFAKGIYVVRITDATGKVSSVKFRKN